MKNFVEIINFQRAIFAGYCYIGGMRTQKPVKGYTFNIRGFGKYDKLIYGIFKSKTHWSMIAIDSGFKILEDYKSTRDKILTKGLKKIKSNYNFEQQNINNPQPMAAATNEVKNE